MTRKKTKKRRTRKKLLSIFARVKKIASRVVCSVLDFFKLNFTDRVGRVNTGRIGQIVGLLSLTTVNYWAIYMLIYPGAEPLSAERVGLLSIAMAVPLLLYAVKLFAKKDGTSFIRKKKERSEKEVKKESFLQKNLFDGWGRLDFDRIGQVLGLVGLSTLCVFVASSVLKGKELDIALLGVLIGDSGGPMLLYRIREIVVPNGMALTDVIDKLKGGEGKSSTVTKAKREQASEGGEGLPV